MKGFALEVYVAAAYGGLDLAHRLALDRQLPSSSTSLIMQREDDIYLKLLTIAGHVQYLCYLIHYLLEMRSESKADIVCWHHMDTGMLLLLTCLAGKQTAIKIGKGAVKGITLSAEHVSE